MNTKANSQILRDLEREARRATETEIVRKLLGEDHRPGDHVRPSLSGGMEVNLKYLQAQMPFFSVRTIQLALYALQAQGLLHVYLDKGLCVKWYKLK